MTTGRLKPTDTITGEDIGCLIRSDPALAAWKVATTDVLVWIAGALISKAGQRRRVLEVFLNAPGYRVTYKDLIVVAAQYGTRVLELRNLRFPIDSIPFDVDRGRCYFELKITPDEERAIRCALAIADRLPKRKKLPIQEEQPEPTGQAAFRFGRTPTRLTFSQRERGMK